MCRDCTGPQSLALLAHYHRGSAPVLPWSRCRLLCLSPSIVPGAVIDVLSKLILITSGRACQGATRQIP